MLIFLRDAKLEFLDPFAHIVNDLLLYRHGSSHFVLNATCEDAGVKVENGAPRSLRRFHEPISQSTRALSKTSEVVSLYHGKVLCVKSHAEPTVD